MGPPGFRPGIGDQFPDQGSDDRGDHQRKNQDDAQKPGHEVFVVQQQGHADPQEHLYGRTEEGILDGNPERMPKVWALQHREKLSMPMNETSLLFRL